ncbi:hypothetical protein MLD38_040799 [Melastoma candidum]|nr:hypothetical protein MLD38_040799 [Melastoma candidum]
MGSCSHSEDRHPPNSQMLVSSDHLAVNTDGSFVPERENHELEEAITVLRAEIMQLKKKRMRLDERRREALNDIANLKGTIRVFCRVRPFLQQRKMKTWDPVEIDTGKIVIRLQGRNAKEFEFDEVFPQEATQEDVFAEVESILRSALHGHNVCVLAYGQTGAGKTFTMDGMDDQPGIILRTLEKLFKLDDLDKLSSVTFSMSMLEVYMGNLRDLLVTKQIRMPHHRTAPCRLHIRTDQKGHIEIDGLTEVQVPDLPKAKWWYNKGRRARSTSSTNVNGTSSRSHCLTRISVVRRWEGDGKVESSKLWLVDLGGSERLLKSGASGLTLDEGRAINLSLSALGDVIASLRRKKRYVPYRQIRDSSPIEFENSKLTQILKDSVGDDSKVLMVVHVSPRKEDLAETLCSLSFAKRARAVELNQETSEAWNSQRFMWREKKMIDLEETVRETEEECRVVETQLTKAEFLLSESKKLLSASHGTRDDQAEPVAAHPENQPTSSPKVSTKSPKTNPHPSSLPRFMNSTTASHQRQVATEQQIAKIWKRRSSTETHQSAL